MQEAAHLWENVFLPKLLKPDIKVFHCKVFHTKIKKVFSGFLI